jgi:hypothetical protein
MGPLELFSLLIVLAIFATPVLLAVRIMQSRRLQREQRARELAEFQELRTVRDQA